MANFQNNSITEYGRLLLAEVQAGAVFIPTRIVLGSGNLPAGKEPTTMTDVVSPVKDLNINKKEKTPDGKVVFGGAYDNQGVTKPFYLRELALYARAEYRNEDGSVKKAVDEVLYSYGNAGATADYMPAYSTETVVEKQLDIVVYVGNSAKVELTIASGTAMTVEMGEQMVDGLRKEVGQALEGKAEKTHTHTSEDITGLDEAMSGALKGKADKEHTHTKKDITDFPESLPASDVYDWAKQPNKPTYTAGEVGAAPSGHTHDDRYYTEGEVNELLAGKAASSHTHPVSNITGVLPVSKGGTGQTSLAALMSAMGAGKIVVGSYTGNGAESMTINLGFTPRAVLVIGREGQMKDGYYYYGGLAVAGSDAITEFQKSNKIISIVPSGFTVYFGNYDSGYQNIATNNISIHHYIAFG